MSRPLTDIFNLEDLGENCFRGCNQPIGNRVFGGQVVAQALNAASRTCPDKTCHSLHGYFVRHGKIDMPIDYKVEILHDGRSFSNRRVVALQNGKIIFSVSASFHVEEAGFDYQSRMPKVPSPEELKVLNTLPIYRNRQRSSDDMRVEIRPVLEDRLVEINNYEVRKYWWIRFIDALNNDSRVCQSALSYASDFGLLGTAREAHGIGFREPGYLLASLDHSVWFHRDFRCDDWMLYSMDCPNTALGRGFARGQIFEREGRLIATVAQEGLIRAIER